MQPGGQEPYEQYPPQPVEYTLYSEPQYGHEYAPPPAYPAYQAPSTRGNTFGLLSMIFGIVAFPMICCFNAGIAVGIAAVVLGVIGTGKASRGEANNKAMSIAGIACGAVAAAIGLVILIITVVHKT